MNKILEKFFIFYKFDFKTSGFIFFFPYLMWTISIFQLLIQNSRDIDDIYTSVVIFQGIYIPLVSWGIMFRLKEIFEDGAKETLKRYYRSNFLFDFNRYLFIHLIGTIIWCIIFVFKYNIKIIWPIHIIHFFLITLFFMFFGIALILIIKNIELSLSVLFIYLIIEIVTLGEYMPWQHVFLFHNYTVWDINLKIKFVLIGVYTLILFFITLFYIKRND